MLTVGLALACDDEPEGPPPPDAIGALVFDLDDPAASRAAIDARLATEIEVIGGHPIAERVANRLGLAGHMGFEQPPSLTVRRAVRATRRGDTLIVDVSVTLQHPERAVEICNATLETYLEQHMQMLVGDARREMAALAARADDLATRAAEAPESAQLAAELERARTDLAVLERDTALTRNDARILEPCSPAPP